MVSTSDLKIKVGGKLPFDSVKTVKDRVIPFKRAPGTPGPRFVHLCLARFSGCPLCNLTFRTYSRNLAEVAAADCELVVVYHSPAELILENQGEAGWAFASESMGWVADPSFELYNAVGSGRMPFWRFLTSPKIMKKAIKALWAGVAPKKDFFRRVEFLNGVKAQIPLDVLIDTRTGVILDLSYGPTAADHKDAAWAVAVSNKAAAAAP